jgi:hypothetical protein
LKASYPAVEVIARGTLDPEKVEARRIQTWSSLGDLASRFRADAGSFPKRVAPALMPDPTRAAELRAEYQASLPGRLLVGLAWRDGSGEKSSALADWLPLFDRPDVGIVALFPGSAEAELAEFSATGRDLINDRRLDFSGGLGDYAAQIQACDAVVAVDDLSAVIAAATGRPTLKVRRPVDNWWWGAEAAANPWFPSLAAVTAGGAGEDTAAVVARDFIDRLGSKG